MKFVNNFTSISLNEPNILTLPQDSIYLLDFITSVDFSNVARLNNNFNLIYKY